MKTPAILILFSLMFVQSVKAQLDNSAFITITRLEKSDSNKLALNLSVVGFSKNNEYFNRIADGYTLFGYQLMPTIQYQPRKNVALEAGLFLRKDFGNAGIREVEPIFRFTYEKEDFQFIFGNLEGNLNHRLIEPLFDFENYIQDPLELGIQARYFGDTWSADVWVDWRNMIYEGDPEQEEVVGGLSFRKELFNKNGLRLEIPIQAVVYHTGGQIDLNPNPIVIIWNSAVGAELSYSRDGLFNRFTGSAYYLSYEDYSPDERTIFSDGSGWMINGAVNTSLDLETMLSYWRGNEYFAPTGGQLYPSVSSRFDDPGYFERERELLILRFTHNLHLFDNVYLVSRFEPYYDLRNQTFEFSHGLYVSYRQPITLLKNVMK